MTVVERFPAAFQKWSRVETFALVADREDRAFACDIGENMNSSQPVITICGSIGGDRVIGLRRRAVTPFTSKLPW
ncbi:MAG: hypothetical protein WKF77_00675 [Planctomycetaceae bacterium]